MKVSNTSARLICVQTGKTGRVDILPGVVTDDKRLDKVKGSNKIFDYYLEEGILKEVTGNSSNEKDSLKAELKALGGAAGNMSVDKLKIAVREKLEEKAGRES